MSRLSFRPRPLDIHKKLPIVKSVKDFEDDDAPTTSTTRSSQLLRLSSSSNNDSSSDNHNHVASAAATNNEVNHVLTKKVAAAEIPTPQFVIVDTYERDYSCTFSQPTSYLRGRGARAEVGEFIEYDLDNEDDDWLQEFNKDKKILSPERFESLLFKFEVLDHKARERAGVITPTLGSPIPILLQLDAAVDASQALGIKSAVSQSVYYYWKEKRERWQKPILRRLQPPPPVNDTNPYNVFRPREKAHRLHTRRMQRRENNVQSFEKLRQVRRNLEQAKIILEALIKREERKRDVMENEVSLQRLQMKYKHETELLEDGFTLPGYTPFSSKFGSSEEDPIDSDEVAICRPRVRPSGIQNPAYADSSLVVSPNTVKQEFKRQNMPNRWFHKMDPLEPVMLFTKPVIPEKLAAAGIVPPSMKNSALSTPHKLRGRIGRGGRIIFDRWNPLLHSPIDFGNALYLPPRPQPSMYN